MKPILKQRLQKSIKTVLIGLFSIFLISANTNAFSNADKDIQVIAKLEMHDKNKMAIIFYVKNFSNNVIKIVKDDLPWKPSASIFVLAVDPIGVALERRFPIADPNFDDFITLKNNEVLEGKIILIERIPQFDIERKKKGLVIFWSYKPLMFSNTGKKIDKRFGGWLEVK